MPVITLTTDFGIKDGTVGVMKGVIWGICPSAQISDLSHMISAQNIREAALIFARSVPYFPKDSVHVVVVDPGVGTKRRPMAAKIGEWFFVGPDNGIITILLERAEQQGWQTEFVELDRPQYWLQDISHVFHGRDIFSPVAAHLANGEPLGELGSPFKDPVRLELPRPEKTEHGWQGEVIHIDHFGNVSTNIRIEHLGDILRGKENINVRLKGREINGMVNTFGERPAGDLIALMGSTGYLGIAVVNSNAAEMLDVKVGDTVEVIVERD
ncbi:MAG TPA: SAM-dependent chlorinase/fluorinase [Anaerolineales bacterium]|nr:SAM-dependent chlorinase/fluorinase [Anaerolineales bacterium]